MFWEIVLTVATVMLTLNCLYRHRMLTWSYTKLPYHDWLCQFAMTAYMHFAINSFFFVTSIYKLLEH